MMPTLFVCHSVGDTNAIMAAAKAFLKKAPEDEALKFLLIGKAAEEKFRALPPGDLFNDIARVELIYLSRIVGPDRAAALENGELIPEELGLISAQLGEINKALIGTPSQNNCIVPFQVAGLLADRLEHGCIYNDYLFEEKAHAYWGVVAKEDDRWLKKYTWLLPLPGATELVHSLNPALRAESIGHPSIDSAITAPTDSALISRTRGELEIAEAQALLFISGTKDLDDDQALLWELYHAIASDAKYKNIVIRIGLHPGAPDLSSYVESLQAQIPEGLRDRVKLVITPKVEGACAEGVIRRELCISKGISGDNAANAANAVACSVPATLVNSAALQGKPGFYLQDKEPFIQGRLLAGRANAVLFLDQIASAKKPEPATKGALGLCEEAATEIMAKMLLSAPDGVGGR
jgi:hypothetical protein